MSKPRDRSRVVEDRAIFADLDFDAEEFIGAMEDEIDSPQLASDRTRPAWHRLEVWLEHRALQKELEDWEDWELE